MKVVDGGILIEPEDIPAMMGVASGFVGHVEELEEQGKIPGSFKSAIGMMTGAAERFMKAVESR